MGSHTFAQVPAAEIQRSSFDRSHTHKTAFDSGVLVPIYVDEAVPGDSFNMRMSAFARLATPLKPFMDNVYLDSFFFAVPYRLVWDNFKKFMGEQENPGDSTDYLIPEIVNAAGVTNGSLADYMGVPTGVANTKWSALFQRSYQLVWNTWFRDQNLQNSIVVPKGDGPDTEQTALLRRGKRHDYFTSCLPWPQKNADVIVPFTGDAPIVGLGKASQAAYQYSAGMTVYEAGGVARNTTMNADPLTKTAPDQWVVEEDPLNPGYPRIYANLAAVAPATINMLRESFQIQRLYERDARGGTRYPEILKAHFGVHDPQHDVLQRPVYLGGGSSPVNIHPVAQTSGTAGAGGYTDTPQGNLSAFGTASIHGHGFTKSFTEHCLILGLVSVRAELSYQNGLHRMFSRRTRFDHYWPALAHLGEQSVLNKEIFYQGTAADDQAFGYQERFAEMRFKNSIVTGPFRSQHPQSLDLWHLAQDFASLPTLSGQFIEENPPISRVVAVTTEPQFLFDSYFKLICARPMPVYGVPGMIDHF